jgi:hypothetical protein
MNSFAKGCADLIVMGTLCIVSFTDGSQSIQQIGVAELVASEPTNEAPKPSIGNLSRLHFEGRDGHYTLNGTGLSGVSDGSISFSTANRSFKVRVTLLKTVQVSFGKSIDQGDDELVGDWSQNIPRVAQVLKQQDALGSLKVVSYDLIGPRNRQGIHLQEQLTLLWSADPAEAKRIGQTGFGPLMRFSEPIVDVQYRTPNVGSNRLFKKIFLQIFYIQKAYNRMTLGSFVIVSNPSGEYQFYLVPRSVLDRIVISTK